MSSMCKALVVTTALLWGYPAGAATAAGADTPPLGPADQPTAETHLKLGLLYAKVGG